MSSKTKNPNTMQNKTQMLNVIHRLLEFIVGQIIKLIAVIKGPADRAPPIKDVTLLNSATVLALKIRNKQLTSESVVQSYIDRIKEIQPVLNCVVEDRFEDALAEARKCDELLRSGNAPSPEVLAEEKPFFGVPFTTKDCIGIANMKQTAGLVARKNIVAERDAESVRLMKAAGAIPLATTNVSELAMWWETSNCLYGTTKNPYNTRHIVGGSSGGEGCIQAAAGSPVGIGSDIGGSIRMPSYFNGIFGHKPSKGIVSNDGQYPSTHSDDQDQLLAIGPMCRHAQDLKPTLKVLADKNAHMLNLDKNVNLSEIEFYYMEEDGGQYLTSPVDLDIKRAMKDVIRYLKQEHNVKATKLNIKKMKKSITLWTANMTCKDERYFSYELTNRKGHITIWWEVLKWMLFMSNHTIIALFTAMFERFAVKYGSDKHTQLIQESKELCQEFQNAILLSAMTKNALSLTNVQGVKKCWVLAAVDVFDIFGSMKTDRKKAAANLSLILNFKDILGDKGIFFYPTHPTAAPMHYEPLIKPFNFSYTAIFNVLGLPATTCPLGLNRQGLPIGIQVIGGLYQDRMTIAVAEALERRFGGWVLPNEVL